MSPSLSKIEQSLIEAKDYLWNDDSQNIAFDSILETLSKTHAQIEVQRILHQTTVVLREQSAYGSK